MTKDEALKLAREALEEIHPGNMTPMAEGNWNKAITAIREALADSALDRMADNARTLGLDYEPIVEKVEDSVGMGHKAWDMIDPNEIAKAFHEAFAEPPCKTGSQCTSKCPQCEQPNITKYLEKDNSEQPAQQQEPVAWMASDDSSAIEISPPHAELIHQWIPLYTSPPASKPWVGLTDEERNAILDREFKQWWSRHDAVCRAIETKLREKNA